MTSWLLFPPSFNLSFFFSSQCLNCSSTLWNI